MYAFSFRYSMGGCWEEIPKDGRSMIIDVDLWCSMPHSQMFLGCDNMNDYDTSGIAMLEGCSASDEQASQLVQETCEWACKHGRPVARCLWKFAREGRLQNDRLRNCWLAEACGGQKFDVTVACEPHSTLNVGAEVARLDTELAGALQAHTEAEQRFVEAETAHNASKEEFSKHFGDASAEDIAKQRQEEKVELEDSQEALYLARERLAGVMAELDETQQHLEGNKTSHAEEQQKLQSMLSQASSELNNTRSMLAAQRERHDYVTEVHRHQRRSLIGEIAMYEAKWLEEQAAHNDTKSQLKSKADDAEEAKGWLNVTLVALAFVTIMCAVFTMYLVCRERKWRSIAVRSASNMGAHVVLGRPVTTSGAPVDVSGTSLKEAYPVKPTLDSAGQDELSVFDPNPKIAWA